MITHEEWDENMKCFCSLFVFFNLTQAPANFTELPSELLRTEYSENQHPNYSGSNVVLSPQVESSCCWRKEKMFPKYLTDVTKISVKYRWTTHKRH